MDSLRIPCQVKSGVTTMADECKPVRQLLIRCWKRTTTEKQKRQSTLQGNEPIGLVKNYGAQRGKIRQMFPEYDEEQITKIDEAYYKAFPGVKQYHEYCYQRASYYAYTQNLFGIKYYGVNGHKLINMLVQGSAAFYLKMKIRELYEFRHKHNLKTRIQMQIHDELSWEYNSEDDPKIFFEFQKIMHLLLQQLLLRQVIRMT